MKKRWIHAAIVLLVISMLSGCVTPPSLAAKAHGADLMLTETVDQTSVHAGDRITFTITVTNRGPDSASGIVFGSSMPIALIDDSCSCSQGTVTGRTFCEVDHLASGKSAVAQIVATVVGNPYQSDLGLNNIAYIVEYIANDPNRGNNSASVAVHILPETLGETH